MDILIAIERQANQELVPGEKFTPVVIEQHAIGLDRIMDHQRLFLELRAIFFLKANQVPVEIKANQSWFPTLESKGALVCGFGDGISNQCLECLVFHHAIIGRLARFGDIFIEAIAAAELAIAGCWFDQQAK